MSALVEEVFNKINTHKGIEGIIVCDGEGIPIKSSLNDEQKTYFYTTSASLFVKRCRNLVGELFKKDPKIKELDKEKEKDEELTFIRIRTKQNEIMIAPENEFILIVIQNPSSQN